MIKGFITAEEARNITLGKDPADLRSIFEDIEKRSYEGISSVSYFNSIDYSKYIHIFDNMEFILELGFNVDFVISEDSNREDYGFMISWDL